MSCHLPVSSHIYAPGTCSIDHWWFRWHDSPLIQLLISVLSRGTLGSNMTKLNQYILSILKWLLPWLQHAQAYWQLVLCPQQDIIRTEGRGKSNTNYIRPLSLLCSSSHLHFSLLCGWSSCAGFLKTWLPFLMLMGIILTVALTLNLRWPGRQVEDTVEPLQVGCGVDLLDNKGCITWCRANVTEEIVTFLLQEEIVEQGCPTHVHQHALGLWRAGGRLPAVLQWWSLNGLGM